MALPGWTLLTGAGGGLGVRTLAYFLERGERKVLCTYRSRGEELFDVLTRYDLDPEVHAKKVDLTIERDLVALSEHVSAVTSSSAVPLWGVVNLAGASSNGVTWKLSQEGFQSVIDNNLISTFLVTKALAGQLRERSRGRIVNISSVMAHAPVAGAPHYCAAKAAIEGFTRAVAVELASKQITVNALALGYFAYGLIEHVPNDIVEQIRQKIPFARLGDVREFASALLYLLSEDASYITGQTIHVNGGLYT